MSQALTSDFPSAAVNRPPRPLLSRVAESAFWMSKYVERAEHVARVLVVNINSLLDVGDLSEEVERQFWAGTLQTFLIQLSPRATELLQAPREAMGNAIAHHMVFDMSNPNSIASCITRARENARSIRENISAEMWESLNTLYWAVRAMEAPAQLDEGASDFLKQMTTGSMLFQGLADQTLGHGQVWQFVQLGKYLERIDVTCRVVETKLDILQQVEAELEQTERNMHLVSIVRSCCAVESFRRRIGELDPDLIAAFLLLERGFPRSVCFSATAAHRAVSAIHAQTKPAEPDPAESILGRLQADLQYASPTEIADEKLRPYLQRVQGATLDAVIALRKTYFLQ